MLAILDYKAGNQTSVKRALEYQGIQAVITADAAVIDAADGVVFPGVGAAGQAMAQLSGTGMDVLLATLVRQGKPLLGICLGCQILLEKSAENATTTLGLVSGECRRFSPSLREEDGSPIRVPHMGWNGISIKKSNPLLAGIPPEAEFYFVHSYYVCPPEDMVLATCHYGQEFCAVYGCDGLWAVQFHLEKSGAPGLRMLLNFHNYCQEVRHAQ